MREKDIKNLLERSGIQIIANCDPRTSHGDNHFKEEGDQ